jgi:O-antigen/teichoic acid export membrane protein
MISPTQTPEPRVASPKSPWEGSHVSVSGGVLGKFVDNLGYGGIRGVAFLVNSLVIAPVLMFRLGPEIFALFALATPFLRYGFNGVFDLGLATGVVRFVSREAAASNREEINRYVASALFLYLGFGVLLLLLYRALAPALLRFLLSSDLELYSTANLILGRCAWIYLLFLLSNAFFGLLMGIQRVPSTHLIGTVSLLIELLGILALLPFGLTASGVTGVYLANGLLSLMFCAALAWRSWPGLQLRLALVSRRCSLDLLHYTARYSVTVSTTLIGPVIDKLILTRLVGLSFVAAYEAAARLTDVIKRATQLILLPLLPLAGAVEQTHSVEEKQHLYERIFSANLVLSAGLYLIPATLAFPIFLHWVGPTVGPAAAIAFIVLAGTSFLLTLANPAVLVLAGTGRMKLLIGTGLASLTSNIFVSIGLAKVFGFKGVLTGTALAYGGVFLIMVWLLQQMPEFRIAPSRLLQTSSLSIALAVLPGLLVGVLWRQPYSLTRLLLLGTVLSLLYGLTTLCMAENRRVLCSALAHLRKTSTAFLLAMTDETSHA